MIGQMKNKDHNSSGEVGYHLLIIGQVFILNKNSSIK